MIQDPGTGRLARAPLAESPMAAAAFTLSPAGQAQGMVSIPLNGTALQIESQTLARLLANPGSSA